MNYNKYSNKKVTIDGFKFDSKKEAKRYSELKLLLRANKITDLILQPKYLLHGVDGLGHIRRATLDGLFLGQIQKRDSS